jgi:hypothetical protein
LATAAEYENKIKSLDWNGLRSLWDSIEIRNTAAIGWDAGKAFEYLVLRAFELDGAKVKFSPTQYYYLMKKSNRLMEPSIVLDFLA